MPESMRKLGRPWQSRGEVVSAGGVAGLSPHDHLCFVYDRDADARRAVLDYAVAGLARQERVVVLTAQDPVSAGIGDHLRTAGVPVDDLLGDGVLVFGSATDFYLAGGVLEPDKRLVEAAGAARSAVAEGHTGLRVYAETQFLLDRPDALLAWPGYELRADLLFKQIPMTAVCAYDARRWAPGNLVLAETVHTRRSRDHQDFRLRAGRDGTLWLSGDIDLDVADQVFQLLVKTTPGRAAPVLDVSGVTFIDVSGARAIGMAGDVLARPGPVTVRGASPQLRTIWRLAEWSGHFPNVILEDRQ
jgi:anti-anti-sigma regulatory factor